MPEAFPALRRAPLAILNLLLWPARACWRGRRRVLIALAVLVALHLIASLVTGLMLRRELNRLRKAGEPMGADEILRPLQSNPMIRGEPGVRNAAWAYEYAFDCLTLTAQEQRDYQMLSDPPAVLRLDFGRRVIPHNARYFKLLDEASRIKDCAFPVNWQDGAGALLPHLAKLREAGRWLALRAELMTSDGLPDDALADAATILRMAEHAKTEPTFIAQLVAYALQGIAVRSLENTLSAGQPSPAACRGLYDQLAAIDQIGPSVRAMQGERVLMGMWAYDSLRGHPIGASGSLFEGMASPGGWRWPVLYVILGRPLFNLDEIAYLRFMREETAALKQPWPASMRAAQSLQRDMEHTPYILARMIAPVFTRFAEQRERTTAILDGAQIALGLKAYQAEHGAYPESLAALEQAGWRLPTDPFTQKPYHYRREGAGFLVWSTGPDMDDDNGRDIDPKHKPPARFAGEDYDITFRCTG